MVDWGASLSILTQPGVMTYIMRGVAFTLILSVVAVGIGIMLGSVLALARNYCTGAATVFKWLSSGYIELFRNTPLLLWIFICLVACPCPAFLNHQMFGLSSVDVRLLFRASVALVLFTSSVLAEIIRGGLNSVAQGQFEAGHSQGFSTVQVMWYIVLPQAYKAVVPTMLSQVITTVKDSSYLANVAAIELMARVRRVVSTSNMYNGVGTQLVSDVFVMFGLAALIYFIINFSLSCAVRALQHRKPKRAIKAAPLPAAVAKGGDAA